jgi:enhancing lycopene biosynthesis protein 2
MARVAVVLSGCGVMDGSEIHESVSVLLHLSRAGAEYHCFAPDVDQMHVMDHLKGEPIAGETRNVLREAARIARGDIRPLTDLKAADYDAVFFPGGFGAAKNLCDFATKGAECVLEPQTERVLKEFHAAGKPIGLCCIAPVLAARALGAEAGGPGVSVTVGNDPGTAAGIESWGADHVDKPVTEAHVDERANVVTAPAYMYGQAALHEVDEGIGQMVGQTLARIHASAGA